MIHVVTPYDPTPAKNLGRAYNKAFENVGEDDWVCLMDWDAMFLCPTAIKELYGYVEKYPDTGLFTCWTNRIHKGATQQLHGEIYYDQRDILAHIHTAEYLRDKYRGEVTQLRKHISGFLMMISKETWNKIKFSEDKKCLGVDNDYSDRILDAGKVILRMDGLYVFHLYRMGMPGGTKDKTHLL